MEQTNNLELEILLTLRNNKVVPTRKIYQLFDQEWDVYRSTFNELIVKRYFKISTQIPSICTFELNQKGSDRIVELLVERAKEIEKRLSHLNEIKDVITVPGWSTLSGILNFLKGFASHNVVGHQPS